MQTLPAQYCCRLTEVSRAVFMRSSAIPSTSLTRLTIKTCKERHSNSYRSDVSVPGVHESFGKRNDVLQSRDQSKEHRSVKMLISHDRPRHPALPITFHCDWASASACMYSDTEEHCTGRGGPLRVLIVSLLEFKV